MKTRLLMLAGIAVVALAGCGAPAVSTPPATVQQAPAGLSLSSESPAASQRPASDPPTEAPASAPLVPASPSAAPITSAPALAQPVGPAVPPTPASYRLGPLVYIRQTLNNCGPASIAEVLHFWGAEQTQGQAQAVLRPDGNSRGMWPYGVPGYVRGLGMSSLMGVGGNPALVKALVANGFPVIASQWVSLDDREGHYREIEGFDDKRQVFVSTDSYLGPNHEIGYSEFDQIWARGNQRFMVIYPPAKQPLLNAVLASAGWSKEAAYQADLVKQKTRPSDPSTPTSFRRGDSFLGPAWDHIQLGDFETARSEIQQAKAVGASPTMVGWLTQALAS
jgi:uncharacterized protein